MPPQHLPFSLAAPDLAPRLIGCLLVREGPSGVRVGRIVEVEAYTADDPASHSFRGLSERNRTMFGPPGRAYVYLIYGVHFCLNVVCGSEGSGQAVLLRAVEPLIGLEDMWRRRFEGEAVSGERVRSDARKLASGPGKICQAFSVTRERDDGASLEYSDLRVLPSNEARPITLARDRRIGISRAAEKLRRFADAESRFLSRGLSQHAEFFEA